MELSRDLKPPKPGPRIEFVTPRNTTPISYVVISRRIWAHPVHWTGSRTTPCTLKLGLEGQPVVNCEGCKAKMAVRWKGYLHVVRLGSQGDLFLCLTPNSGDYLLSTYGADYDLRGVTIDVWRAGKTATTQLLVRVHDGKSRIEIAREELDPGPYLETVFRLRKPRLSGEQI